MERSILYQRSDIHKPTGKVKQNNTPRKKEQIKGNKDQGADNATEVSKQKDELVISCQKLTANEAVITKETDNNVNCLEQYGPPAKRIKREEIGDMLKVIYNKRLDDEETVHLTRAMINSGITLRWPADWIVFDKHSTEGVGDKVSLVLAPVLAACGLKVPIISDMAQQHTGGALDRLESIPGFHIMQEDTDMRQILNDVGCCIVSQTSQLIPADRIMYAVRNDTTTEHEHCLITGSIISKKAVESQDSVGFDLGCETGTFYEDGQVIKMVKARNSLQIKTITLLTDLSSTPLGKTFGNALEVAESIQCLQGKGPKDLTELVKYLGGHLLVSLKKASNLEQAYEMIDDTLSDDKSDKSAIVKFKAMIEAQGVDQYYAKRLCDKKTDVFGILLSASVCTTEIQAKTSGCIQGINVLTCKKVMETLRSCAEKIRNSQTDGNTVGLKVLVNIGDAIEEGWPWIKIYHNGELSGELVKDIGGAIEIYQDPTEPNKRRTDYENEEESKEHTKKKEEFSNIRIKEIKVQASEFPRYEYALGNLLDVVMRYKVILQSNCIGHDGRNFLFYICTTPENDKMIDDFLQEITKKGEIRDGGSLEQFVQSKDQSSVSCFITPENYHHILTAIRHRTTMSFILCETDLEEKAKRYQNTYAIQKNNAWKQIDSVLEKWLFQSLKPVCGALGGDIERNLSDKNATNRDVYEEKPITDDEQTNETNVIIFLKKDMLSTLKTETKDCLFEEIIGLFNMSDVSIDDIPNIPKYRSDLDLKEILRHLSSTFEGILGVGCRMQKLQIAVKDGQNFTSEEKQNKFRQFLHDFKIYEYEIVPMSMKNYLTPGDSIAVGYVNNGSFGCFAKETKTQNEEIVMYGLFSKHLVPASNQTQKLYLKEGGESKSVGEVIGMSVEGGKLDIAAAALSITKDKCDTRFKTASGKQISGDKRIIESKNLVGRKVHIWGAKSKPGKGIITVPEYRYTEKMDFSLILVEDIADGEGIVGERFSQPGDSGAIACTDVPGQDCVIPISMIMGGMNYKEVKADDEKNKKTIKGRYATVPLQSGLRQISERIGKQVELC